VNSIDRRLGRLLRWTLRSNYAHVRDSVVIEGIPMGIHFELENANLGNEESWARAMSESDGKSLLAFHGIISATKPRKGVALKTFGQFYGFAN
jgi:hypothetical protein